LTEKIDILGHPAKVISIIGAPKRKPFHPEDTLSVWLEYDEPVDGTQAFGINIPVRDYSKDDLIMAIRTFAENCVLNMIKEEGLRAKETERLVAKKAELDTLGGRLLSKLSG